MLGLGRELARAIGVQHVAVLTRIEGGVALRAPGAALVFRDDHIQLFHWTRSRRELRMLQDHLTRKLGGTFTIEDIRAVAAQPTTRRVGNPSWPPVSELTGIVPDQADLAHPQFLEEEDAAPKATTEDDFGPGL